MLNTRNIPMYIMKSILMEEVLINLNLMNNNCEQINKNYITIKVDVSLPMKFSQWKKGNDM